MSAVSAESDAIGATRFMEKPVSLEEFLPTIEELLGKPAPSPSEPISETDFYTGYRKRLEIKLAEKNTQITRAEGLLRSVSESEKEAFSVYLHQAINERKEILRLLDEINIHLAKETSTNETKT